MGLEIVNDALRYVETELELPLPDGPGEEEPPEWPSNVALLSDDQIGQHIAYWAAIRSYAAFHLALADTGRTIAEEEIRVLEARALILVVDAEDEPEPPPIEITTTADEPVATVKRRKKPKPTATMLKARAAQQPEAQAANQRYQEANARYKLLHALHQGYEQRYQAVSREISRRQSERMRGTA